MGSGEGDILIYQPLFPVSSWHILVCQDGGLDVGEELPPPPQGSMHIYIYGSSLVPLSKACYFGAISNNFSYLSNGCPHSSIRALQGGGASVTITRRRHILATY